MDPSFTTSLSSLSRRRGVLCEVSARLADEPMHAIVAMAVLMSALNSFEPIAYLPAATSKFKDVVTVWIGLKDVVVAELWFPLGLTSESSGSK